MKKIIFTLLALVGTISMNAQVMKIMKNGEVVATYTADQADEVVFKEGITGTAKRTGDIDVNWVQLWEDGPRFAEYNVGAAKNKAEDYGGYYCWGKSADTDANGVYKEGDSALTGDDDTATALWGSNWRMPKQTEFQALLNNCDALWTTVDGVNGCKFTGRGDYKDNSIFLPAAGNCYKGSFRTLGSNGYYWSSTPDAIKTAYSLYFGSLEQRMYSLSRQYGYSVRAVLAE